MNDKITEPHSEKKIPEVVQQILDQAVHLTASDRELLKHKFCFEIKELISQAVERAHRQAPRKSNQRGWGHD